MAYFKARSMVYNGPSSGAKGRKHKITGADKTRPNGRAENPNALGRLKRLLYCIPTMPDPYQTLPTLNIFGSTSII